MKKYLEIDFKNLENHGNIMEFCQSEKVGTLWTLPNLYSEVSKPKILLFSYWFFMQIGWREALDTSEP